jgi:hypothetical protein
MNERRTFIFPSPANDNYTEKQLARMAEVSGEKVSAMEVVFNASRTQELFRWKEHKVNAMRAKIARYTDIEVRDAINRSSLEDWEVDPVYFFTLVEKLRSPGPADG